MPGPTKTTSPQPRVVALVIGVVTVLVGGLLVYLLYRTVNDDPQQKANKPAAVETPRPGPSTSRSVNPEDPHGEEDAHEHGLLDRSLEPLATPVPESKKAAEDFARAFFRKGLSAQQWRTEILEYCSREYAPTVSTIDPGNVPDATITGEAVTVSATDVVAIFEVPTTTGPLRVNVLREDGKWVVIRHGPGGDAQ